MTGDPRETVDLFDAHSRASNILLRGYLRLYILEQLHRQPGTGAEMAETLHESCKWKPSPGTIYPPPPSGAEGWLRADGTLRASRNGSTNSLGMGRRRGCDCGSSWNSTPAHAPDAKSTSSTCLGRGEGET